MKCFLFTYAVLLFNYAFPQISNGSWTITQNAQFPLANAGVRYMDAVDDQVIWLTGFDGTDSLRNYNWFSVTNNGGSSFTSGNIFGDTNTYRVGNIDAIDASTAWVSAFEKNTVSKGYIFQTTDGGFSWTNMTAAGMYSNSASFINFVTFLTPLTGITQGDPSYLTTNKFDIWRTTDGGITWLQVPASSIPANTPFNDEYGISNLYAKYGANYAWFGTNKGRVFITANAGASWQAVTVDTAGTIKNLAFADSLTGVAYTESSTYPNQGFKVFSTFDGGLSWLQVAVDANIGKTAVCAIPGTTKFASIGADSTHTGLISYSEDTGASWVPWQCYDAQYLAIDFVNENTGWAGSYSDANNALSNGVYKFSTPQIYAGIQENNEELEVSVYPNPAKSNFKLLLPENIKAGTLEVFNIYGGCVFTKVLLNNAIENNIDLAGNVKGVYFLRITTDKKIITKKVVLE
jgi:photosystem II stability/assembly factor-like uncharacterized protein